VHLLIARADEDIRGNLQPSVEILKQWNIAIDEFARRELLLICRLLNLDAVFIRPDLETHFVTPQAEPSRTHIRQHLF